MTTYAPYIPPPPRPIEWAVAAILLVLACAADARASCPDDQWCVDKDVAVQVRDKARGYEVLCSELEPASLSPGLTEVCEDPGATSRVWVEAERYREAEATADELQRKVNVKEGRVVELEGRVRRLEAVREKVGRLEHQLRVWRIVGLSAGGLAALSSVAWIGHVSGWWRLPAP